MKYPRRERQPGQFQATLHSHFGNILAKVNPMHLPLPHILSPGLQPLGI